MNTPVGREFPEYDSFGTLAVAAGAITSVLKFNAFPLQSGLHPVVYGSADRDVVSA